VCKGEVADKALARKPAMQRVATPAGWEQGSGAQFHDSKDFPFGINYLVRHEGHCSQSCPQIVWGTYDKKATLTGN
jgi:hypothetical protein